MPEVIARQETVLTSLLSSNSWQREGSLGGPTPKSDNIPSESRGRAQRTHAEHCKSVAVGNPPGRGGHQNPPNSVLPHLGAAHEWLLPAQLQTGTGSLPRNSPASHWSTTSGPLDLHTPGPPHSITIIIIINFSGSHQPISSGHRSHETT